MQPCIALLRRDLSVSFRRLRTCRSSRRMTRRLWMLRWSKLLRPCQIWKPTLVHGSLSGMVTSPMRWSSKFSFGVLKKSFCLVCSCTEFCTPGRGPLIPIEVCLSNIMRRFKKVLSLVVVYDCVISWVHRVIIHGIPFCLNCSIFVYIVIWVPKLTRYRLHFLEWCRV